MTNRSPGHVEDQLWDWLQGAVSAEDEQTISEHLATCEECSDALESEIRALAVFEHARAAESADSSPNDSTQEAASPEDGRRRLLGDATTLARFRRYVDAIARLSDVDDSTAESWLSNIDDEVVWSDTALEDMHLYHIEGGPRVENAIFGFVRLQPTTEFPEHTHVGDEAIFVIQGAVIDEHGHEHGPGSLVERPSGTTHTIVATDGHPAIYLSIVQEGLEVFGMRFGPDSPVW